MRVAEEHSSGSRRAYLVLAAVIDLLARLAVPASLFALAEGWGQAAIGAAVAVNFLSVVRGLLGGRVTEVAIRSWWAELVGATRRYDVGHLAKRDDMHSVVALIDAVVHVVHFEAHTVPGFIANGLGVLVVLVAIVVVLGGWWLFLGVGCVVLAAPIVVLMQRYIRRVQSRSYERFNDAALAFEVLLDGAMELRVHGVEERHARTLMGHVHGMARAERRGRTASVLLGLLPLGVALLAAVVPMRNRLSAIDGATAELAQIGILGATALALALGLLRNIESYAKNAPFRRTVRRFIADAPSPIPNGTVMVDLARVDVTLDAVAFRYPDSNVDTPRATSMTWSHDEGLALAGANGAGKTTLALCVIGLLRETEGAIRWGETAAADMDWQRLRPHVVHVPQHGFVAGNQSVLWHLRLLATHPIDEADAEHALRAVGLWEVLESRGRKTSPLAVAVTELSGGERKRMHLARALIGEPRLVVLDEPEAGLDAASRTWLRQFIEELATITRVLIIAHDPSVIPSDFRSHTCVRSHENRPTAH